MVARRRVGTPIVVLAVLAKDLRAELRSGNAVMTMAVFAVLTLIVFNFAFPTTRESSESLAPGVLWIAFFFAGMLGLNRSAAIERESGAIYSLLLAPIDRGAIYLGKWLANTVLILLLQAIVLPLFALLYNFDLGPTLVRLLPVCGLGATALAAAGTVFASIAVHTRMRDLMTPLLLLPAATPVLIAAVEGSAIAFRGETEGYATAIRLLVVFTVVFTTVSYLIFDFVVEE